MLRCRSELLAASDVEQIHQTSMRILANVGVEFPNGDALSAFRRHGGRIEGSRVYLDEGQLLSMLDSIPAQFTIHARDPERSVVIGNGEVVFAPGYGAPFLADVDVGRRQPIMADYRDLARLAHQLPNQDISGHLLVHPDDVPARTAYLHMLYANMVHSDKPFLGSSKGMAGSRHTMEMSAILFERDIHDWPVTCGLINSLSPLGYSGQMLDALAEYARWRQPVVVAALAMAGLTAPITLAGLLAMQNAELLAGLALTQLISPGTPVVYGSASSGIDLRTGALAIGSPELSLLVAGHAQLARRYGIPSRSGGSLTDASRSDAQAGFESMLSLLTAVDYGLDLVIHAGGILSSYLAFSFEKFVLDDEMCGMVRHISRGIGVGPETLAYDVIAAVGPGGNYLMEDHTLDRCRTEFWQPAVCDRGGLVERQDAGRLDASARARQRWQDLLAQHEDPPLDAATARKLREFVEGHAA